MNIDVTIYSESKTVEPFDGFIHRGYNLELDNDLAVVWKQLASADLLISSISNFNIVPALFSEIYIIKRSNTSMTGCYWATVSFSAV
jgi:hypothetical protein